MQLMTSCARKDEVIVSRPEGTKKGQCLICRSENLNSPMSAASRSKLGSAFGTVVCTLSKISVNIVQVSQPLEPFCWKVPVSHHHTSLVFWLLSNLSAMIQVPCYSSPRPLNCPTSVVDVITSRNFITIYNPTWTLYVYSFLPTQTKFTQETRLNFFPHNWTLSSLHLRQKTWKRCLKDPLNFQNLKTSKL